MGATVEWSLQPQRLRPGERAYLTVTVRGSSQAQPPRLPAIEGLHISGPATQHSTQVRFEQGRFQRESQRVFRYEVVAVQTGQYTLGPLSYDLGAESVELPALQLAVQSSSEDSSADAPGEPNDRTLKARLRTERTQRYQGEVFELVLEILYRDVSLGTRIELLNLSPAHLDIPPFQEMARDREKIDGRDYHVRRFRTLARALSAGTVALEPALRVPVVVPRSARERSSPFGFEDPIFDGFFSRGEERVVHVNVEKLALEIRSLPTEGRPAEFTGAVGRFRCDVRVDPVDPAVGEPLTVTMVVSGYGNLDQVRAPLLEAPDTFRAYDPQLIDQDLRPGVGEGRKTYQQVLIPRSMEARQIPAVVFAYFDPQAAEYKVLRHGPFDLALQPAPDIPADITWSPDAAPFPPGTLGSDILHLKPWRPGPYALGFPLPVGRGPLIALALLPLLAVLASAMLSLRRKRFRDDPALRLRQTAPRQARRDIRAAQRALQEHDARAFFDHLAAALRRYYGSRLQLPPGEVLSDSVCRALARGGWPEAEAHNVRALFETCERARFGGAEGVTNGEALLREAVRLLRASEKVRLRS